MAGARGRRWVSSGSCRPRPSRWTRWPASVTPNFAYTYGAQAIDLSVDIETGHIVVHDAVCAVDAGRAVNPDLVAGQIEGGVVQAHGYAITEDLQVRDRRIVNPRLSTYLMPGILDIPAGPPR